MKSVVVGLAVAMALVLPAQAQAAPLEIRIGISSCEGEVTLDREPGEVVDVVACVSENGVALSDVNIAFVEEGPSPMSRVVAVTENQGSSEVSFSSASPGSSRVIACASNTCSQVVVVTWLSRGSRPIEQEPDVPTVHFGGSDSFPGPPLTSEVGLAEEGKGFSCTAGPASEEVSIPGFAAVTEAVRLRAKHPRTGVDGDSVQVKTSQSFLAGSILYGLPAITFVSLRDVKVAVDRSGPFPMQGFNRVLSIWSSGQANFGKQELRFSGGSWKVAETTFSAVMGAEGTQFFLDDPTETVAETVSAGARVGASCSGVGFPRLTKRNKAAPGPDEKKTATGPALGLFLLVVLGALAAGVFRSSSPPSGGLVVEIPSGPMVRVQRSDIRYDIHGRPTSYVEILELPDGTTRTTRARVGQESLVMEISEMLDVADWEDEKLRTQREQLLTDGNGRLESFVEEITASDGTITRVKISHVVYDSNGRVVRFSRSTEPMPDSKSRSEIVSLDHEGVGSGGPPRVLAEVEEMVRSGIRFDEEGHVTSYVAAVHTDGSGQLERGTDDTRFVPGVPRVMFESGESFATSTAFVSHANTGLLRLRNVLTSWFRQHGCKVTLSVKDKNGHPMSGARFMFGSTRGVLDPRGIKTVWVMNPGNYAVGLLNMDGGDSHTESVGPQSGSELLGWVVVQDIPGWIEADFTEV